MSTLLQLLHKKCFTTCFSAFHYRALGHALNIRERRMHYFSPYHNVNKPTAKMSDRLNSVQCKDLVIRSLREEDIPKLIQLRQKIGMHDVRSSIQTWLTVDPECIKIVETELGEIIGSCSTVKQSDNLYFGGLLAIRDDYRGLGLGKKVTKTSWERGESATNAIINTDKRVFDKHWETRFPIIEPAFTSIRNNTTEPVNPQNLSSYLPKGVTIEPFNKSHLPQVFTYDLALIGYKRERVLELNCQEEDSRTFVAFKNGACVGFGTIKRSCLDAGRVGPLYADDSAVAEVLLRSLIISLPKVSGFAMMTVSNNTSAKRLLEKLNCPKREELYRKYRGKRLNVDTSKVFAHFDMNFTPF